MTKRLSLLAVLLLAWAVPAQAAADITGYWTSSFLGNAVEGHLEQRGEFLYGVVYVTTPAGERNTYHVAGAVLGNAITAMHGGGSTFTGTLEGQNLASGMLTMKNGAKFPMQARREKTGKTLPGGLAWPPGFGPAQP